MESIRICVREVGGGGKLCGCMCTVTILIDSIRFIALSSKLRA